MLLRECYELHLEFRSAIEWRSKKEIEKIKLEYLRKLDIIFSRKYYDIKK